ncbi:MAG: universal stress protein [Magnetococcales bacterium]|nr:universal stress protein [Magnetococcales bacterium]
MQMYKHVMFASDLSQSCDAVGLKAKEIAWANSAKIIMVHIVIPFEPGFSSSINAIADAVTQAVPPLEQFAKSGLEIQAKRLGLHDAKLLVGIGSPKREIVQIAQERDVDLIIIGGHGLHGLDYILGSTADGVLHRAKCDVLIVRMRE